MSILLFAYGSNLSKKQMAQRCPQCKPKFTAVLHNYRLIFVDWSRQWHGGVATIKAQTGERVPGGVYEVSEGDLRRLDKLEGYPSLYDRAKIKVVNEHGELIEVQTYIKKGRLEEAPPAPEYLAAIRQGYRDWELE